MNSLTMKKSMYLFAIPALLLYVTFWILPILRLFEFSVSDYNGYAPDYDFVGLANYIRIFSNKDIGNSIGNTLIYTILTVVLGNALALVLSLALNMKIRLKGFYRSAVYIPALFSTIVVGFIWSYVYVPQYGLLPTLAEWLGLGGLAGANLLGDAGSALYAIIIVDIWKNLGTSIVIFIAGLQTVPTELLEAGRIDGCNSWQVTRHIRIPLLAPAITINVTLSVINGLKAFDYPFIMTSGGPGKATYTLIYHIYRVAFNEQLFGKASAIAVVAFAIIIAITAALVVIMRKREVQL